MNTVNTNRTTVCLCWGPFLFFSRLSAPLLYHTSIISGQLLWPQHLLAARLPAIILMDRHSRYTLIMPQSWHIAQNVSLFKWLKWKMDRKLKRNALSSLCSLNLHLTDSAGSKYLLNHDILFLLPQLFSQGGQALAVTRWQAVSWPCSRPWFTHTHTHEDTDMQRPHIKKAHTLHAHTEA